MLPIFKVGLGGPIGDGKQWMSWIHRTDLCALITQALVDKKYFPPILFSLNSSDKLVP